MVSGYVLILAVLLLGGVIATLGDRIGMRVGKARLSLFNLRPKQTATVVSIATGSVISASTLALLFGISSQLRTGVFELGNIQAELANAKAELDQARADKEDVVKDLESSVEERERAMERLQEINRFLDQAVEQREMTEKQLRQTREQLANVSEQAESLRQVTESLKAEREDLLRQQAAINSQIADRDAEIAQLDQVIAQRDQDIAEREQLLARLEEQQDFLEQQVTELQRQYQGLFLGNIALGRNQELVSGVVRVENRNQADQFINQLLFEANRQALQLIAPGTPLDRQIILISSREVERLAERLITGQEYVIRVLSAANYITGESCVVQNEEPCIQIFFDATENEQVYAAGERLATVALDSPPTSDRQLVERVTLLLAATQFRARQDGIVSDDFQIADNRTETILEFFEEIKNYGQPVDIQAIAATDIFTVGPLNLNLQAIDNGVVIASTERTISPFDSPSTPEDQTELWKE
jgi:uncharacterized protein (DUF3084 family)